MRSPSRYLLPLLSISLLTWQAAPAAGDEPAAEPPREPVALFNGRNLDGWQVVDRNDFENHGTVEVRRGAIHLESGEPMTGIRFTGDLPRQDYEIRLEARRVEGGDFFCGLTVPIGDGFGTLILGGWGGGVTGISNIDGQSAVENETTDYVEFENGRWYAVRLRLAGGRLEAWVDDRRIVRVETEDREFAVWWEQEPVRPLGITTWRTHGAVRNITLTRLAGGDGDGN